MMLLRFEDESVHTTEKCPKEKIELIAEYGFAQGATSKEQTQNKS